MKTLAKIAALVVVAGVFLVAVLAAPDGKIPEMKFEEVKEIASALNLAQMDEELVGAAAIMGAVYTSIAAFENSTRRFIAKVLVDAHGSDWWRTKVSEKIRTGAEARRTDEERTKWHGRRGDDPINYTEMGQLVDIMGQNWTDFEPHVRRAHRVDVGPELIGQRPHRWKPIARLELLVGNEQSDLGADLAADAEVRLRVEAAGMKGDRRIFPARSSAVGTSLSMVVTCGKRLPS